MLLPHIESTLEEQPPNEDLQDWACLLPNCALCMLTSGNYKAAENSGGKAVETRAMVLGEEHPSTLTSMGNLASTYMNQGRWKEAEELEMSLKVLGEEHPDTLTIMVNLAIIWKNQGRTRDALALMRSCIVLQERVLDTNHPHTVSSAAVLADWENMSEIS
ncbi:Kinesin light chain [Fusarium oxysporum f. sp. cubense]|uniref:Kinesin light chain n=1 Tax=Fusarium oxysporum f. sp. cubense TaxID=61366 RepID=A0A559KYL6_FUSOC|nr:Kinesin light chain [Fusarium oxysporum f. sp. cubense]